MVKQSYWFESQSDTNRKDVIAAAHLGHVEVVRALTDGKAPLDHVNNLGWTALI